MTINPRAVGLIQRYREELDVRQASLRGYGYG